MKILFQFLLSTVTLIASIIAGSPVSFATSPSVNPTNVHLFFTDTEEGQTCKKNVLAWVDEVHKQLPGHLIPTDFFLNFNGTTEDSIYRTIHRRPTEVLEKIVFIANSCRKSGFIHEYSHLVLDHLMRRASPAWRHSITWDIFNPVSKPKTIDEIRSEYIKQIRILKEIHDEHRQKVEKICSVNPYRQQSMSPHSDTKNTCGTVPDKGSNLDAAHLEKMALHQTGKTIKTYEGFLDRLNEAQKIDDENPFDLHEFNLYFQKSNFRLLDFISPFHELFADTSAVLILNDWSIMKEATAFDINKSHLKSKNCHQPGLNEKDALSNYLNYRDFRKGLSVETYPYRAWEKESSYCQFAPIRSLIRDIMDNNPDISPGDMIEALGMAIIHVFENEFVPSPENIQEWPSIDKNRTLAEGLIEQLNQKGWQPVLTIGSSH